MNTDSQHACVNMYLNSSWNKVQRLAWYCYNNYDNFHILGIQPVYGYIENKVNEWMNERKKGTQMSRM
jgi:hypothetical protein